MEPRSLNRRSPVYRKLQDAGAEFVERNGYAVASAITKPEVEAAAVGTLSLCDLSGLARLGFKGPGATEWLSTQGLQIPTQSNRAIRQQDGLLLAKLAPNEALLLDDLDRPSQLMETLMDRWQAATEAPSVRGFPVSRQDSHAWFAVTGTQAPATLAKLCAVDLRPNAFPQLQVAQTSIARLNAIVIRDDLPDFPVYHLLADLAASEYWWDCLLDAGLEHDVRVVGLGALRRGPELA